MSDPGAPQSEPDLPSSVYWAVAISAIALYLLMALFTSMFQTAGGE